MRISGQAIFAALFLAACSLNPQPLPPDTIDAAASNYGAADAAQRPTDAFPGQTGHPDGSAADGGASGSGGQDAAIDDGAGPQDSAGDAGAEAASDAGEPTSADAGDGIAP